MNTRTTPIYVTDAETRDDVEAELIYDLTYDELRRIDALWVPYMRLAAHEAHMRGVAMDMIPDHKEWSWSSKLRLAKPSWRFFGIDYHGYLQGAIVVSTAPAACRAPVHNTEKALGVEYVAAAPWNIGRMMRALKRQPLFDQIGPELLKVAIALSHASGCEGRLYLYAVPKAEYFYREKCGMIDLGEEVHDGEMLRRFEMTSERAAEFMAGN